MMKVYVYVNWNNGPDGPFATDRFDLIPDRSTRIHGRKYKIQTNPEGAFFIRKSGRNHRVVIIEAPHAG